MLCCPVPHCGFSLVILGTIPHYSIHRQAEQYHAEAVGNEAVAGGFEEVEGAPECCDHKNTEAHEPYHGAVVNIHWVGGWIGQEGAEGAPGAKGEEQRQSEEEEEEGGVSGAFYVAVVLA